MCGRIYEDVLYGMRGCMIRIVRVRVRFESLRGCVGLPDSWGPGLSPDKWGGCVRGYMRKCYRVSEGA